MIEIDAVEIQSNISNNKSINQFNFIFVNNSPSYEAKNNKSCAIINKTYLYEDEVMFEVKFEDGSIAHAFPEELFMKDNQDTIYSPDYLSEFNGGPMDDAKREIGDEGEDDDYDWLSDDEDDDDVEYFDDDDFDDEDWLDDDDNETFDPDKSSEDDDDEDL